MPIRQYAKKHGLSADSIAEVFSESHDQDISPDDEADITELDDFRESVYANAIADLQDAWDLLEGARESVRDAESNVRRAVQEALEDGMPATRVGKTLGVSRARVYQIRDGKR